MIEIVVCTDDNYVMPLGVLMTSVLMNSKDPGNVRFFVISEKELTASKKKSLEKIINKFKSSVQFCVKDLSQIKLPTRLSHVTLTTYMRLFIADILPKEISKVIYLDCDMICRHDLSELWNEDISGFAIGCCKEGTEEFSLYNNIRLEYELGYCNTGVLLMNLDFWRKNHILEECMRYAKKYPERCVWYDQDILNSVLKHRKRILNRKYNVTSSTLFRNRNILWTELEEAEDAIKDPVIIHYTGCSKPWQTYDNHPYKNVFRNYQSQTEWAGIIMDRHKLTLYAKFRHYLKSCIKSILKIKEPIDEIFVELEDSIEW